MCNNCFVFLFLTFLINGMVAFYNVLMEARQIHEINSINFIILKSQNCLFIKGCSIREL